MREAVIVSAVRTAVGKAPRGMYRTTLPEVLAVAAMRGATGAAALPLVNRSTAISPQPQLTSLSGIGGAE